MVVVKICMVECDEGKVVEAMGVVVVVVEEDSW